MIRLNRGLIAAIFAVAMTAAVWAQPPELTKPAESSSQRAEILALLTRMETSFAAADAKALAACWAPSGEFIGPGGAEASGRDNIEKLFSDAFAMHKDGKLLLHVEHFRLVNDGLALIDAVAEVKPAAATGGTKMASFVVVKQEGHWLIERAHEMTAQLPPQANPLKDLQWMIGDWACATSATGITLRCNCDWTVNRGFLIRKFKVEGKEAFLHGGTEVIGWDPRSKSIRSWVFDSDGGFGESTWVHDDNNRWLVKFCGTLPDGSSVSATNVISKVDDDTVTLQSKERSINGTAQPDIPETTLKRQVVTIAPAKTDEARKLETPQAPKLEAPRSFAPGTGFPPNAPGAPKSLEKTP